MNTSHFKLRIWLVVLIAAALGSLTLLIPVPAGQNPLGFHLSAALPVFNLGLFVPGAILFLTALSSFKKRLRIATGFFTSGFLLSALGTLQFPIISLLGLTESAWATQGFAEIPFLMSAFCMFFGAWLYARLVEVKRTGTWLTAIVATVAVLMLLATQLPHVSVGLPESYLDTLLAFNVWEGTFELAGALLLLLVKRRTNLIYNRAMAWLIITFCLTALGCALIVTTFVTTGFNTWYFLYNGFLIPFIISGFAWLKSAEAFHNVAAGAEIPLISEDGEHDFFGRPLGETVEREANCIDVVTFLASLCSNPTSIDEKLDIMRTISVMKQPGQPLGAADQEKLAQVALDIEQYLIEDDPVRTFTRQGLHQMVYERYKARVDATAFWQKFESVNS